MTWPAQTARPPIPRQGRSPARAARSPAGCPRPGTGERGGTAPGLRQGNPWIPAGLVRGLVFGDDGRRNTAALAYLVTALPRPGPDFGAPLTAGPGACLPAPAAGADPARVLGDCTEVVVEFLGVRRAHIDLVRGAVKRERNCLLPLSLVIVGKVTHDCHHSPLSHGASLSAGGAIFGFSTYTRP